MLEAEKPLAWISSSKKDLMALPLEVRKFFGHALDFAQRGDKHDAAKVLKGFGGAGVLELVEDGVTGFLVDNEDEMLAAIREVGKIDRQRCREQQ